jgi:acyl transferase domain-containing protein
LYQVPYAYHTSQVDPILASLSAVAIGVQFAKPAIPVISPTCGRVLTSQEDFGSDFVVRHCRNKVDMLSALQSAKEMQLLDERMMGIELGPEPIVIKMVKDVAGSAFRTFASCRRDESSLDLIATALAEFYTAGANINWMAYHADFSSCQVVLDLPAYAWVRVFPIHFNFAFNATKAPPVNQYPMLLPGVVQAVCCTNHAFHLLSVANILLNLGSQRVLDSVRE